MTLGKAIVKTCKNEYQHGLLYTACTRVTNDNDLAFIGHDPTLVGNQFKFPSIQRYRCQCNTFSMLIFFFEGSTISTGPEVIKEWWQRMRGRTGYGRPQKRGKTLQRRNKVIVNDGKSKKIWTFQTYSDKIDSYFWVRTVTYLCNRIELVQSNRMLAYLTVQLYFI